MAQMGKMGLLILAGLLVCPVSAGEPISLDKISELAEAMEKAAELQAKLRKPPHKAFELMSAAELRDYFSEPPGYIAPREVRGWKTARELAQRGDSNGVAEVMRAIENNHRRPAPSSMHLLAHPIWFWDHLNNPIGHGTRPAANLHIPEASAAEDLSRLDPVPSTFWQPPVSIASQDLYVGFGRAALPRYETNLWEYDGPKTSWGGCPGFDARCGDMEIKVKLRETRCEPFTARIFHAVGFHVDPTDHAPHLKVKYTRRLLREFHLRKDLRIRIRALGIRLHTINLQKRYDPFSFIAHAVLHDGRQLSGNELKRFLLRDTKGEFPEDDLSNFRQENEAQVAYLVTTAANVQLRDTAWKAIGPWAFDELGHENLRELRGAGLLAAWLGWYDSRFENMRLKVCQKNGQFRLAHFFNDLGGGMGKSVGVISRPMESAELFRPTFTSPRKFQGKGKMTIPFRIRHFQPIQDTAAFEQMTMDDARWMARRIAQISEEQIVDALIASGFSMKDVRIFTDKLISRRDRMIRDLELGDEIPPLRRTESTVRGP